MYMVENMASWLMKLKTEKIGYTVNGFWSLHYGQSF